MDVFIIPAILNGDVKTLSIFPGERLCYQTNRRRDLANIFFTKCGNTTQSPLYIRVVRVARLVRITPFGVSRDNSIPRLPIK